MANVCIGEVCIDVCLDSFRNEHLGNSLHVHVHFFPLTILVELNLGGIVEHDFIASSKAGIQHGVGNLLAAEMVVNGLLCFNGQLRELDESVIIGKRCRLNTEHAHKNHCYLFHNLLFFIVIIYVYFIL